MAANQTSKVIQHLRRAVFRHDGGELTDGQLLGCFIDNRDEAAFAALVRRHGPMVWGVCRRLLPHHDTEDAFQAAFLVLFRKAASIRPREMVANWLYGVAHQTALQSRRTTGRRKVKERQVPHMPEPAVAEQERWQDLQPLLDQELALLPDKYRVAIVLCDLEGKTRKEVARQLSCPEGTVAARLVRGRVLLAKRLARYGLAVSGGGLAAMLAQSASASGPPAVVSSAIHAATLLAAGPAAAGVISVKVVALTEGVLKTMLLKKLKRAAGAMLVVLASLGMGVQFFTASAAGQPEPATVSGTKDGKPVAKGMKNTLALDVTLEKVDGSSQTITARTNAEEWSVLEKPLQGLELKYETVLVKPPLGLELKYETVITKGLEFKTTKLENIPLGKNARIVDGGKEIKAADLKEGMRATLELAVEQGRLVVVGIRIGGKESEKKP
jgi:RNA polymerase sigma factor (sigma-70 family)